MENMFKTELLLHQKEALKWLTERESTSDLPRHWRKDGNEFVNQLTKSRTPTQPEPMRGGAFNDENGLGRTLTLLYLIAADKREGIQKNTLVVSHRIQSTWVKQIEEHSLPEALKTYHYSGGGLTPGQLMRTKDRENFEPFDLVLVGYNIVHYSHAVKAYNWWRVILDFPEPIERITQDLIQLKAQKRWVVTDRPIHKGPGDILDILFMEFIMSFLGRSSIERNRDDTGLLGFFMDVDPVQDYLVEVTLRREKNITLPSIPVETRLIVLNPEERNVYDVIKHNATTALTRYDEVNDEALLLDIEESITSLSQVCAHFEFYLKKGDIEESPLLMQKFREREAECPICMHSDRRFLITACTHIFCQNCIMAYLQTNYDCPICRGDLTEFDLLTGPIDVSSTKVDRLLRLLRENPATKAIVFSNFSKMLKWMERPLHVAGFQTLLHLDSGMSVKNKNKVVERFKVSKEDEAVVLLANIEAVMENMDLSAACSVYIMEACREPVEKKAVNCVRRVGQKKTLKVIRLVGEDSIEERILTLGRFLRNDFGLRKFGLEEIRFILG